MMLESRHGHSVGDLDGRCVMCDDLFCLTCRISYLLRKDSSNIVICICKPFCPVAAARAWNSLPLQTRAASSWETKSHLFRHSFGWRKSGSVSADWQLNCQHETCNIICAFFVKCPRNCCLVMVSLKSLLFLKIIIIFFDCVGSVSGLYRRRTDAVII